MFSSGRSIGHASPNLFLERLFHVGNGALKRFKTETHKVCYPDKPGMGTTAFVARRDHPGHGVARMWHRFRSLCSASTSELRKHGNERIHLSVAPHQLGEAYECISAMLMHDTSPFDDFEVINPSTADIGARASAGVQVSLYVHDQTDRQRVQPFLMILGKRLDDAGIEVGSIPAGDASLTHCNKDLPLTGKDKYLAFFSYRFELMPNKDGEVVASERQMDSYASICSLPRKN